MFDLLDSLYNFYGLNQKLFLQINHSTNIGILPHILKNISWLFSISKFAVYYIVATCFVYFKLNSLESSDRSIYFWLKYNELVRAGITYSIFGFIYAGLKFAVNKPRPFCSLAQDQFFTIANTAHERCLSSFPSAHTGIAVMIAYFIWPYLKFPHKIITCIIVMIACISRITLAMHYPADIIGGVIIALFVIILGKIIFNLLRNNVIKLVGQFAWLFLYGSS